MFAGDGELCLEKKGPSLVAALKACAQKKDLFKGTKLHGHISRNGLLENSPSIASALLSMYAKCGALAKAYQVLDEPFVRDMVCWSALIAGCVQCGQGKQALDLYQQMLAEGFCPDAVTFTCVLKACGILGAPEIGKKIHGEIVRQGFFVNNIVLGTALLDMYVKCGELTQAQQVLENLQVRNVVSWSAIISGYAQQGQGKEALKCFDQMLHEGLSPNVVTFVCILNACASIGAADKGRQIHSEIVCSGLLKKSTVLGNALLFMYTKCGVLAKAKQVFEELPCPNVVSWSTLIAGYAQQGKDIEALGCFEEMQCKGLSPDAITFSCVLKACGGIGAADKGKQIHDEIASQGLLAKNIVLSTALVDMYVKCGLPLQAQQVLDEFAVNDTVSWNALIAGYIQQEQGVEALNCFDNMQRGGLSPDVVTFACILKACGIVNAAEMGKEIHEEIEIKGLLREDITLGNALVDMYAKCGMLKEAEHTLDRLPVHDAVSWNAIISGYVKQVQGKEALKCFEGMQLESLSPDAATFTCVLNACGRSGLVDEGQMYLTKMSEMHGISFSKEHYGCMVDLYGRAGCFGAAVEVVQKMPVVEDSSPWSALLAACKKWENVKLGEWAFKHAIKIGKRGTAACAYIGNIYAAAA